jgi:hypothetical protein
VYLSCSHHHFAGASTKQESLPEVYRRDFGRNMTQASESLWNAEQANIDRYPEI